MKKYQDYMLQQLKNTLEISSPTGFTTGVQDYLLAEVRSMGFEPNVLNRGGFCVDIGGEGNPLTITAHADEIGLAVKEIKPNGKLKLVNIAGLHPTRVVGENVEVVTRSGRKISGTFQPVAASVHVTSREQYIATETFENTEVVLDELVFSKEETKKLGIKVGDMVAIDPKTRFLPNGFIKSRFLDDKTAVAISLTIMKMVQDGELSLTRKVYLHFGMFEEVGTGGSTGIPSDSVELIAVDIGCVGAGMDAREDKVSIISQDARVIYDQGIVSSMIDIAEELKIDYSVDINTPSYGSDCLPAIMSGLDVKVGLVGPGVYATHGYERTHTKSLTNTLRMLTKYIGK